MKNKHEIEKLANQTLNSLDNLQQLEANDYLHTRIWQRVQDTSRAISPAHNRLMLRLAAVLFLFVGINCTSYYVLTRRSANVSNTKTTSDADAFAEAYSLANTTDSY